MEMCSNGHEEICHSERYCPLCEVNDKIQSLEEERDELMEVSSGYVERIDELQDTRDVLMKDVGELEMECDKLIEKVAELEEERGKLKGVCYV